MNKPILITGMARSGTSWVGKMLSLRGETVYINEPMNPEHPPGGSPGILNARIDHRYFYIDPQNGYHYHKAFERMLALRFNFRAELLRNQHPRDIARAFKYAWAFDGGRDKGQRPLVDDPFAAFAAPWIENEFGCQVVVLVRHPAAIVSSRLRLGHRFDFNNLLAQLPLMRRWLGAYRTEMKLMADDDLLGQGALLWKVIYGTLERFRAAGFSPLVIRHEDLCLRPHGTFAQLYHHLGLTFTEEIRDAILASTQGTSTEGAGHTWSREGGLGKSGYRPMDSRALTSEWQKRLDPDQIERIRQITQDVATAWYPNDWPEPLTLSAVKSTMPSQTGVEQGTH